MKKSVLILSAIVLLFAGCAKEKFAEKTANGGEEVYSFTVGLSSDATKAVADNDGHAACVNHWVMEVLDSDGARYNYQQKDGEEGVLTQTFDVRLVKGQVYNVLFWADTKGYYNVDSLRKVKLVQAGDDYPANNDALDAFSAVVSNFETVVATQQAVTLKRPFGQMNIIFTDLEDLYKTIGDDTEYGKFKPENLVVTAKLPTEFNVMTQKCGAASSISLKADSDYLDNYDTHRAKETIFMDYIFASADSKDIIDLAFSFESKGTPISHNLNAVPFQRNYRTNIMGEFMSSNAQWNVTIDPVWESPDYEKNIVVASTLADAQTIVEEATQPVTVKVTQEAANNAKASDLENVGGKNYVRFILKTTSPTSVEFDLPDAPTTVGTASVEGWLVTYEENYPTTNVGVYAPANTKVKILAPTSHVEVTGTTYAEISAKTGDNSLIIPVGVAVESLIIEKGGLEIHGTVNTVAVNVTGTDKVYVRACEGLSETVKNTLLPYIAEGYSVVQNGTKYDIVLRDEWPNFAAKSFSSIDETNKILTITSPEELALFAKTLNAKGSFKDYTVNISGNLDMGAHKWIPINAYGCGNISNVTIQGPGSINNLIIKNACVNPSSYNYYSGFIGQVDGMLTIKDLNFNNADVEVYEGSGIAVVVGLTYHGIKLENVIVNNSKLKTCTKAGALIGFTGGDGITPIIKNCKVLNTSVKARYSYALMVGLVNTSDGVSFEGENISAEGSTTEYSYEYSKSGYEQIVTYKGYKFGVDDTTLWVCDVLNALAEVRVTPDPQITISDVTYNVKGSKFYYADRGWVDITKPIPSGDVFSAKSDEELAEVIAEISNNEAYWNTPYTIQLGAGTYGSNITIKQFPQWNGIRGNSASGNNTCSPTDKAKTVITLKGAANFATKWEGSITVVGYGYSQSGDYKFGTNVVSTTIEGIAFDNTTTINKPTYVVTANAASCNVYVKNCSFNKCNYCCLYGEADNYTFNSHIEGCTYNNSAVVCQGYAKGDLGTVLKDLNATGLSKGFLNAQGVQNVSAENCNITFSNAAEYGIRTKDACTICVKGGKFSSLPTDKPSTYIRDNNAVITLENVDLSESSNILKFGSAYNNSKVVLKGSTSPETFVNEGGGESNVEDLRQ